MHHVLSRVAAVVERFPATALVVLLATTVVLGLFASEQEADTDMTAFTPESDLAEAHERVMEEFGESGASIQVIVDAGTDGDVLTPAGLQVADRIVDLAGSTPELEALLVAPTPEAPAVATYGSPFIAALAEQGLTPEEVDAATLDPLVTDLLSDPATEASAGALLSDDLEADGTARAGLAIVQLDGGVGAEEQATAELAFRDVLAAEDFPGFAVAPFSEHIFADELLSDMEEEMPALLGLAFLLIVAILFVTYRRISDVLLGLTGLVVTIVWTFGIAVLLGPSYLGVTGVLSQISIMIPVLLVGLAIDFAIHLTSRYREELHRGQVPARAARRAVTSVGGALVLATITTMVGFLTNVVSPLPPMRDFGLFVAAGVLSAFIVMLLLVPAGRSLLDRRQGGAGSLRLPKSGAERGLGRNMARAALLAERHPGATLTVAAMVTAVAGLGGLQVSTTFDQNDFVPEESEIGALLATMEDHFGGDLDEVTSILLDGDPATPQAATAMLSAQERMDDTPFVRTAAGSPQVESPATAVVALAEDPDLAVQLDELGFEGGGFAADADVGAIYDLVWEHAPQLLSGVLAQDHTSARLSVSTTAGQPDAVLLRDELRDDVAPLEEADLEVTIVSENLMFEESLEALTSSQARGILITLAVALLVLVGFYTIRQRRPMLGLITMLPSALVVAWVAGSMWVLGLSFNVMTAMVASLAIGIGVPYGIHITNRFVEDLDRADTIDEAVRDTVVHTGGALVGSATTTAAGFGVLVFASLAPMQQFGIITALTIIYSLVAAVLIEPACLKLWAGWHHRHQTRDSQVAAPGRAPAPARSD